MTVGVGEVVANAVASLAVGGSVGVMFWVCAAVAEDSNVGVMVKVGMKIVWVKDGSGAGVSVEAT